MAVRVSARESVSSVGRVSVGTGCVFAPVFVCVFVGLRVSVPLCVSFICVRPNLRRSRCVCAYRGRPMRLERSGLVTITRGGLYVGHWVT